jgi:hypothetical protein
MVQCWGGNYDGQLGNGTRSHSSVPVGARGITDATAVTAGSDFTCALLSSGKVACWGKNGAGVLGNSLMTVSSVPVAVTGITNAAALAAGRQHTCALLGGGTVQCWGLNDRGQLGNATTKDSSVSTQTPQPPNCEGTWPSPFAVQLTEGTVRQWFEEQGLAVPSPLPTCHHTLTWSGQQALLCSRHQSSKGRYAEVLVEVLGAQAGLLVHWLSLPVAAGTATDPACTGQPSIGNLLIQLDLALHPDNEAIILRELHERSCVDSQSQLSDALSRRTISSKVYSERRFLVDDVCKSHGVYTWSSGKITKTKDGVIHAGPAVAAPLDGGRLRRPCVDPYSHAVASRAGIPEDITLEDDFARALPLDLDLDGDGTRDIAL